MVLLYASFIIDSRTETCTIFSQCDNVMWLNRRKRRKRKHGRTLFNMQNSHLTSKILYFRDFCHRPNIFLSTDKNTSMRRIQPKLHFSRDQNLLSPAIIIMFFLLFWIILKHKRWYSQYDDTMQLLIVANQDTTQ